jgi:recombination protein RecA
MALKAKNMAAEKTNITEKVTSEKEKALELAINQIEKRFGKGAVMKLGENTHTPIDVIPSGSLSLDIALGVGGIPKGRITEIFGPEASGKTTLAQHIIAEAQKRGMVAAYIDVEHALDRSYASDCGVKTEDLYISQPDTGEQALEITEALVRSGAVDIIVVDSVAALVPQAEIEGEMGDSHVGLQARLMSQALRKLAAAISKSNAVVIFINQLREKVGIVYGNPEVTPGGRALKFYSSVRIDLRRTETIMAGSVAVGNHVKAKIVKNKVAPPFRTAEFDIMFAHGISKEGDLIDLGVQQGLITKSGAFFSYGDVRLGQGRENAKTYLSQHPELALEIEQKIRASAADVSMSPSASESAD